MLDQKKYKELPVDIESFSDLINQDKYFVDKTPYIKTVLKHSGAVQIFTRPRRFGKSLFMNMLADFLRINKDNPDDKEKTKELFKDTAILKDQEFTDKYLGNFPVFNISLKSVFGNSYIEAYKKLAELISKKALEFDYLNESDKLLHVEKRIFQKLQDKHFLSEIENNDYLTSSIKSICNFLYQHYKKQVVVIIDDYDIPLTKAAEKGYHEDMVSLMCAFLNFLKAEPRSDDGIKPIYKIIMTGCLKVTINDFLSGPNNLSVNTVLDNDENFTPMFGFNKAEVIKMLDDYDMSDFIDLVTDNYGGYRFFKDEMFCSFDEVNFIKENYLRALKNEKVEAGNYWNKSSSASSTVIKDYLAFLSKNDNQNLQNLVDGKTIDVNINDFKNHDSLSMHKADDFYTLLLHTGYLTSVSNVDGDIYTVKIPNREIHDCFKEYIMAYFYASLNSNGENKAASVADALLKGETDTASDIIFDLLQNYVSVRDFATKTTNENLYHGFLSSIFSNCPDFIKEYKSNTEAGNGYADINFLNKKGNIAVVIEIKVASNEDIVTAAEKAVEQIKKMKYADAFKQIRTVKEVICYGLSFNKKDCYLIKEEG